MRGGLAAGGDSGTDPRTDAGLNRFLLAVIHDLRSPLRQGILRAQLLQRCLAGSLNEETEAHLQAVMQSHRQADALLNRLGEYCNAGSSPANAPLVSLDLALRNALRSIGNDPAVEIVTDDLPDILVPSTVQKVFYELLDNGKKFRRAPIRIQVLTVSNDSETTFEIRDNGIGFDTQFADALWEPLQRLHGAGDFPGFGLGLAICRRIVAGLGGRMWATSQVGSGSSFFFSIPADR